MTQALHRPTGQTRTTLDVIDGPCTIRREDLDPRHAAQWHAVVVTVDPVGGLLAEPEVTTDLVADLVAEVARQDHDPADANEAAAAERAAEEWLTRHLVDVAVWTLVTYGVHLDVDSPPRARRFFTHAHLPPTATLGDVVDAAARTRIAQVHEALRTGDYARRMLDEAPRRQAV